MMVRKPPTVGFTSSGLSSLPVRAGWLAEGTIHIRPFSRRSFSLWYVGVAWSYHLIRDHDYFVAFCWLTSSALLLWAVGEFDARRWRDFVARPPALEELLEDPNDQSVCLVALKIIQDGIVTGTDRGAAYFDGNALIFAGERTSFRIGGQDVGFSDYGVSGPPYGFYLNHPTRDILITLEPIKRTHDVYTRSRITFAHALGVWRKLRPETTESRMYPPLAVDVPYMPEPGLTPLRLRRFRISWVIVTMLMTGSVYLSFGLARAVVTAALVAALFVALPALELRGYRSSKATRLRQIMAEENHLAEQPSPIVP